MYGVLAVISSTTLHSLISAAAIIAGSIVGGICSWIVTKKSMCRTEKVQNMMAEENRKYEEAAKLKKICENASIIRLDICTALFQCIRSLKDPNIENNIYPIPLNSEYSRAVASLEGKFSLKELSYIYQLYAIIEKLNTDIKSANIYHDLIGSYVLKDYEMLLRKIYGENYKYIINIDIDNASYNELYENEFIKLGYREVLKRLDCICHRPEDGENEQ